MSQASNMSDKVIVAFDLNSKKDFESLCEKLAGNATYIKVGMECFYSLGQESLDLAKKYGFKIFLDLKLHDIPNTVAQSVYSLCRLGANMINVHALGGLEMMNAARKGVDRAVEDFKLEERPLLIAVTHLTSLDKNNLKDELGIDKELKESVISLAELAKKAGLDGVVSSAHEASAIKEACGASFITVTPGIRLKGANRDDQKRVMTPKKALDSGSDYIVVGRSITKSEEPKITFNDIINDLSKGPQ